MLPRIMEKRLILKLVLVFCAGVLTAALAAILHGLWYSSSSIPYNCAVSAKYILTRNHPVFNGPDGWLFYRYDLACIIKKWKFFDQNIETITALNDSLEKKGIHLVVVPVPGKEDIIQKYSFFPVPCASNQRARFVSTLRRNGVQVVDLRSRYISDREKDLLFRKRDTHWDQKGIEIAAESIAPALKHFARSGNRTHFQTRDTIISEECDLSKMVGDSESYPRTCKMIVRDGAVFKDSSQSDIMIFGDSYTDNNKKYSAGIGAYIAYYTGLPTFTYCSLSGNIDGPCILRRFLTNRPHVPHVIVWIFASRFLLENRINSY